jgi:hypothetical protein
MDLFFPLFIGGTLILCTVYIHASFLDFIIKHFPQWSDFAGKYLPMGHKPIMSSVCILAVFCSHIAHIWLWAIFYYFIPNDPIESFHTALYFSTVTMTTVGYGDIVLAKPWNLLSAIQGANGFICFGWSTAFIFEVTSELYRKEVKSIR